MVRYVLGRIAATVVVMAIVAAVVFALVRLAPGDPAVVIAGDTATAAEVAAIRARLGLDAPVLVQFAAWASAIAQFDLGRSAVSGVPVATLIGQRLEATVSLALVTMVVAAVVAVGLGTLAAARAGTWVDHAIMVGAVLAFSLPAFVVGYALVYVFALNLRWFPVQGYRSLADGVGPWAMHLVLPAVTLGLAYLALITRITRASVLDVVAEDYIRTARAKGVRPAALHVRHALANAAVPILTVVGLGVALLIGGVVVTETVFNIPGVGRLVVDAIVKRDYPVIQGVLVVFAGIYVLINLIVDLSYALVDPRIRLDP
jgi:peptide/nickel transport system permease protein